MKDFLRKARLVLLEFLTPKKTGEKRNWKTKSCRKMGNGNGFNALEPFTVVLLHVAKQGKDIKFLGYWYKNYGSVIGRKGGAQPGTRLFDLWGKKHSENY